MALLYACDAARGGPRMSIERRLTDREQEGCYWLYGAAGAHLLYPLLLLADLPVLQALGCYAAVLPSALILLWAARRVGDRRLRSAVLVRAVALSNMVMSLLWALAAVRLSGLVFAILLAVPSGRALQRLGTRGLAVEDDLSFAPVELRGSLIVALMLVCADALTLLIAAHWTSAWLLGSSLYGYYDPWSLQWQEVGAMVLAASLLLFTAWGLLRLRTWALLASTLAHAAIAVLAVQSQLGTGQPVAIALLVAAIVQLLATLPILACVLGFGKAAGLERSGSVLPAIMHTAVLAAVIALLSHMLAML